MKEGTRGEGEEARGPNLPLPLCVCRSLLLHRIIVVASTWNERVRPPRRPAADFLFFPCRQTKPRRRGLFFMLALFSFDDAHELRDKTRVVTAPLHIHTCLCRVVSRRTRPRRRFETPPSRHHWLSDRTLSDCVNRRGFCETVLGCAWLCRRVSKSSKRRTG